MGNTITKKQVKKKMKSPQQVMNEIENKLLISWSTEVTMDWFRYYLNVASVIHTDEIKQLLQLYLNKLFNDYGFDGYGISIMNETFFMKMTSNIINKESKKINNISDDTINNTQLLFKSFWIDHIIRIQTQFNKKYPSTVCKLQAEPNMNYLQKNIKSQYKLLEWYHYQTEHRYKYASRTQSRIWMLQPSTCKRYYGEIKLIKLNKFDNLNNLKLNNTSISTDPLTKSILFSNKNVIKELSFNNISCFIWYSLTLSSSKEVYLNFAMPKGAFSKRVNASSGGLHPVECYFILPHKIVYNDNNNSSTNDYVFCHYPVRQHALEILGNITVDIDNDNDQKDNDNNSSDVDTDSVFYVLISSVDFREIWKYGERGLRYSLLDIGHGLSSLCIISNLMGWKCQIANNVSINQLQSKFKLPINDHPRILLKINCNNNINNCSPKSLLNKWNLNKTEYITEEYFSMEETWPILGIIHQHCMLSDINNDNDINWINCNIDLDVKNQDIFSTYCISPNYALRHRRSALEFDVCEGSFKMFRDACYIMKYIQFPFKYLVCYILYVIRIENIESGLYLLFPQHSIKYENIYKEYIKKTTSNTSYIKLIDNLGIYQYKKINKDKISKMSFNMGCSQKLCANASFTIDFCVDLCISLQNGYKYNQSHLECGFIGQLLYLHMESLGLGATAIGCYLDDFASSNVGFIPNPIQSNNLNNNKNINPNDLKRFDGYNHPLKNIRSLCHFSCGTPSTDLRYPYYSWDSKLFPFNVDNNNNC